MPRTALALVLALALASCTTAPDPVPLPLPLPPMVVPCVSVAVEPEPAPPALTDAQRLAVDRAMIGALGGSLAAAFVLYQDVTRPEWGRRAAASVRAVNDQCDAR